MAGLSLLDEQRLLVPARSDEHHVRAIAQALISELGISEPPVNLDMVASMLDINRVHIDPRLIEAACLLPTPSGFEIRLRASDPPERQRFSIGHECGHTFHAGFELEAQFRCDPTPKQLPTKQEVERLCDIAGSELLIPTTLFRSDARSTEFGRTGLEMLSTGYQASLAATGIALVNNWPEPAALIVMERRNKRREPPGAPEKLRLCWLATSGRWPFFRKLKSATPTDPFTRAEQGEVVHETAELTGIVEHPVHVELHAWRADYTNGARMQTRVLALARQVQQ